MESTRWTIPDSPAWAPGGEVSEIGGCAFNILSNSLLSSFKTLRFPNGNIAEEYSHFTKERTKTIL